MSGKSFALCLLLLLSLPASFILYHLSSSSQEEYVGVAVDVEGVVVEDHRDCSETVASSHVQTNVALRKVVLQNKITKKMLTYHKGIFSLTPTFDLFVQDRQVKPGQTVHISIPDNTISVTYAYEFLGHKKGKKCIDFELPIESDSFDITFSWQQEPRIKLGDAKPISVKEIY